MPKTTLPPDPNPKKPKFVPPAHACDAHCHIFGPAAKFPYDPKASYWPPDSPFESMRKLHDFHGFERAVIVHASCHGPDMRATLDGIARSGGRYRGTAIIDASYKKEDFQRMHDGGIRAVRFNFVKHLESRPEHDFVMRTVDTIAPLGWHLILHVEGPDIVENQDLFRKIPIPMVIDHMGRPKAADGVKQEGFQITLDFMKDARTWVKICGSERVSSSGAPWHDAIPFAHALVKIAPDRILWGTDWPHPNVKQMPNDGDLVDLFPLLVPDPATQNKILVDNPARLYGF